MMNIESINLIGIDPKVRSGRPYLISTSITVADIAIAKIFHQQDVDSIADDYDLSLAQVYAALAYYYEHKVAIDASIEARRQIANEMKEKRIGSRHTPLSG
ncbi:hypothetical protein MASR2M15_08100 [Anaerolineales bacterium]